MYQSVFHDCTVPSEMWIPIYIYTITTVNNYIYTITTVQFFLCRVSCTFLCSLLVLWDESVFEEDDLKEEKFF